MASLDGLSPAEAAASAAAAARARGSVDDARVVNALSVTSVGSAAPLMDPGDTAPRFSKPRSALRPSVNSPVSRPPQPARSTTVNDEPESEAPAAQDSVRTPDTTIRDRRGIGDQRPAEVPSASKAFVTAVTMPTQGQDPQWVEGGTEVDVNAADKAATGLTEADPLSADGTAAATALLEAVPSSGSGDTGLPDDGSVPRTGGAASGNVPRPLAGSFGRVFGDLPNRGQIPASLVHSLGRFVAAAVPLTAAAAAAVPGSAPGPGRTAPGEPEGAADNLVELQPTKLLGSHHRLFGSLPGTTHQGDPRAQLPVMQPLAAASEGDFLQLSDIIALQKAMRTDRTRPVEAPVKDGPDGAGLVERTPGTDGLQREGDAGDMLASRIDLQNSLCQMSNEVMVANCQSLCRAHHGIHVQALRFNAASVAVSQLTSPLTPTLGQSRAQLGGATQGTDGS